MKKVLITGANGFVGSYLKQQFKDRKVFLTDIEGNGLIKCDLSSRESALNLIEKVRPDEVYHLAAISSPQITDRSLVEKVNVTGTVNLLEAVRKFSPSAKVLLVSSGYVYGNRRTPATEKSRPRPVGLYAESKLRMEKEAFDNFPDLKIIIARPFTHSGKGQPLGLFFPDMAFKITEAKKQANPEIVVYNPQTRRDFTHVSDVVEAYKLIIKKGVVGEIYNICLGSSYTIRELVKRMARRSELETYKIKEIKHGIVLDLMGNNSKIKKLGWNPKYNINQIIDDFR